MERCVEVNSNEQIKYVFPERYPTEPFFSVFYQCVCRKEVLLVPMTLSRYMARGLQDLEDPNEQHRRWALSNRVNKDHIYPEPNRNNYYIECGGNGGNNDVRNAANGNHVVRNDDADNGQNNGEDRNPRENNSLEPRRSNAPEDRPAPRSDGSAESGEESGEESEDSYLER